MALLKIVPYGDQLLRKQSARIEEIDDSVHTLISEMKETMAAADGVGLAAPQVGRSLQLFLIDWSKILEEGGETRAYINPAILELGDSKASQQEGCLSLPEVWGDVDRSNSIKIKYTDVTGKEVEETLTEFPARVFQHEFDHLLGILFIDRMKTDDRKKWIGTLQGIMEDRIKPFDGTRKTEQKET